VNNKGKKTVLILFGINFLYYLSYGVYIYYELSKLEGIGMSMIYWALGILIIENSVLLVGYILLFLKFRIGQILLIIFYGIKICVYIANLNIESFIDIRFVIEIIFYSALLIILAYSKNVNYYIKSR